MNSGINNAASLNREWEWFVAELTRSIRSFGMRNVVESGNSMGEGELFRFTNDGDLWVNEASGIDIKSLRKHFYRELAIVGMKRDDSLVDDILSTFANLNKTGALSEKNVGLESIYEPSKGLVQFKNEEKEKRFLYFIEYLGSDVYCSPKATTLKSVIDFEVAAGLFEMLFGNRHAQERLCGKKISVYEKLQREASMKKYGGSIYNCLNKRNDRAAIRELDRVVDHLADALRNMQ